MTMRTSRHVLAVAVLALSGCGATGGADRPDVDARVLLDGPPAGVQAGIVSAAARGYDEAEGVHLRLRRGRDGVRALTRGDTDLALIDLHDLAGHPNLVAVMAIVQRPLLTIAPRPAAPVRN